MYAKTPYLDHSEYVGVLGIRILKQNQKKYAIHPNKYYKNGLKRFSSESFCMTHVCKKDPEVNRFSPLTFTLSDWGSSSRSSYTVVFLVLVMLLLIVM